jgi:hypothetical protein
MEPARTHGWHSARVEQTVKANCGARNIPPGLLQVGGRRMSGAVIDLYTWTTPNGRKVSVMLEECGIPYEVHPIDIGKGQQFGPEFLAICPNAKIPAIADRDSRVSLFESGAILIHLAEKAGRFLPRERRGTRRDALLAHVADGQRRGRCSGRRATSPASRPSACRTRSIAMSPSRRACSR